MATAVCDQKEFQYLSEMRWQLANLTPMENPLAILANTLWSAFKFKRESPPVTKIEKLVSSMLLKSKIFRKNN